MDHQWATCRTLSPWGWHSESVSILRGLAWQVDEWLEGCEALRVAHFPLVYVDKCSEEAKEAFFDLRINPESASRTEGTKPRRVGQAGVVHPQRPQACRRHASGCANVTRGRVSVWLVCLEKE